MLAFTRTKHRANRLTEFLGRHGIRVERIHGNRSQAQRTQALAGFKSGFYQVLVATDIAARGIDIDALSHVVNFDVPAAARGLHPPRGPDRAGGGPRRRAHARRAERGGGPPHHRAGHRHSDPRTTLPGFDYNQRLSERLEIPLAERLAAMRAQRAGQRRGAGNGRRNAAAGTARAAR